MSKQLVLNGLQELTIQQAGKITFKAKEAATLARLVVVKKQDGTGYTGDLQVLFDDWFNLSLVDQQWVYDQFNDENNATGSRPVCP